MPDIERIEVDAHGARQRLDRYLTMRGQWGSRAQVQRLITEGFVTLDGHIPKPGAALRSGQVIEVRPAPPLLPSRVEAEDIALDALYEDEWLLVINKPAGLVVHPAAGHWRGTLVNALLHHWNGTRPGLDPLRPGIVHRLDKDTSGVLVIAKDATTLADLGAQFRNREIDKQYVACVWGRMRSDTGTITASIGRNPIHRKQMAVRPGGRDAVTRYEVLWRSETLTGVRLFPKTGRTHQLRVHLVSIGHPIVGDALYGRTRDGRTLIARQALHAEQITLRHPHSGERVRFAAPLPDDLRTLQRRNDTT